MKTLVLFASLIIGSAVYASQPPRVVETWGGDGIEIAVLENNSAIMSFDCGRGKVDQGRWPIGVSSIKAVGTYTQETGARPPVGFTPRPVKATYAVSINPVVGTMTMTMKVGSMKRTNTYRLVKNAEPNLRRCM